MSTVIFESAISAIEGQLAYVLGHAHSGARRTDAAHGEKIFFALFLMWPRTLIRTGRNAVRQFVTDSQVGILCRPAGASA